MALISGLINSGRPNLGAKQGSFLRAILGDLRALLGTSEEHFWAPLRALLGTSEEPFSRARQGSSGLDLGSDLGASQPDLGASQPDLGARSGGLRSRLGASEEPFWRSEGTFGDFRRRGRFSLLCKGFEGVPWWVL